MTIKNIAAGFLILIVSCLGKDGKCTTTYSTEMQIQKVEQYFNTLKTLEADFVQFNQDGSVAQGRFYLLRPNKFRLSYTNPSTLLVLSDGNSIINYDSDIGDPSYIDLDSTPVEFILRKNVKLSHDVTVSSLLPGKNSLKITLVKTKDPQLGSLTLIFSEAPFILKAWVVIDAQGTETQVVLSNIKENIDLDPNLFRFRKHRS